MMTIRILIVALLLLVGCKAKQEAIPKSVISRDSMISIMADIHIAEARIMKSGSKTARRDVKAYYMQQVLQKAGVDTARFNTSFDFYSKRPEMFADMYDDVIVAISKQQAEKK